MVLKQSRRDPNFNFRTEFIPVRVQDRADLQQAKLQIHGSGVGRRVTSVENTTISEGAYDVWMDGVTASPAVVLCWPDVAAQAASIASTAKTPGAGQRKESANPSRCFAALLWL